MAADGYQGSLFDASGPNEYAKALGLVSGQMDKVVSSFDALGNKSTSALGDMSTQFDNLLDKAKQFKQVVAGTKGPGGRGVQGGKGSGWTPPSQGNPGGTGGDGGDTMGVGGDHGPAADITRTQTPSQNGGDQDPPQTFGPGTRAGAVMSIGSAAVGIGQRWAAANQSTMMQSSIQGQQFANFFGGGRGDYQTIPMVSGTPGMGGRGTEAYTVGGPSDYYAAQNILTYQMGVTPQRQGQAPGQNAAMFGQALNTAILMDPGINRAGAAQAFSGMYGGRQIQSMAAIGINVRPMGKNVDPNTIFEQIFQKTYPNKTIQAKLTQDDILNALTPGGPLESNFEAAGMDPNSDTFTLFQQYVLGRTSWASKSATNQAAALSGQLPKTGSDMQKQFKLDQGPAAASIKKDSRLAQAKSQVYPAASTASEHLDNASTKLLKAAEQIFGTNTKGGKQQLGGLGGLLGLSGGLGKAVNTAAMLAPLALMLGGGPEAGVNNIALSGSGATTTGTGKGGGPLAGVNNIALSGPATGGAHGGDPVPLGSAQPLSQVDTMVNLIKTASRPTAAGTFDWYGTLSGQRAGTGGTTPNFQLTNYQVGATANSSAGGSGGTGSSDNTGGSSTDPRDAGLAGLGTAGAGAGGATAAKIAKAIAQHESGGNYTAYNAGGGASGAYQFIQSTWSGVAKEAGYGQYAGAPASKAPPSVQDAVATWYVNSIMTANPKVDPVKAVADTWYIGHIASASEENVVPSPKAGNTITPAQYVAQLNKIISTLARGSYNVDATKLALLHAGERVIPAADNYTIVDRYQRLSDGGGGGTTHYHLNFASQSVQLVTAPGTSEDDMRSIAKQFMDSVSKPQIIQSVRSS